ncbi:hypothetical protein JYU34_017445 [Plutella xylostella]|uniref:Uncharacterized protein n=1 Tax=Plutella xylostella TaxID=51655 RepID=A0ABQ7Q1E4_PLUXY|nr:hypothetical protein JYU34_017445 [Plutella xylostella]
MIQIIPIFILACANMVAVDAVSTTSFPIGGLFNAETKKDSMMAFQNIVTKCNSYHGEPLFSKVMDAYSTALDVCRYASGRAAVTALLDARPTYGVCDATCLLANKLNITHLSVGWEPPSSLAENPFTFQYHPSPELISKAFAALIRDVLEWDKFTILYEDDDSFIRLQEVINTWPPEHEPILYRRLDPKGDNRETFKYIFKVEHMSNHILDCHVDNVKKYFQEIIQVDNTTQYQSFILTALDAYMVDLAEIPELVANVSTLHLTIDDPDRWNDIKMDGHYMSLETALTADALNHLEASIRKMSDTDRDEYQGGPMKIEDPPSLCFMSSSEEYEREVWPPGERLRRAMIATQAYGFTGEIEFDEEGKRRNFKIYYSKLDHDSKFQNAGFWNSTTDKITELNVVADRSTAQLPDSVIRVVSRVGSPYFMINETNSTHVYGYAVDLIDAIFAHINSNDKFNTYKYEFYRVEGDSYGNPVEGTKNKKWTGMIGDLIEHKAELGACDLTITAERARAVDFSVPFMSLGISMLFKEPDPEPANIFSFIQPLTLDVWLYLATTYIIVSFILLICARMSQDDWVNPHPCNQNPDSYENIWTLYNCMWLTMGSIMTQGCDILPRAASSRWITGTWWFFVLIFTASYTANMSMFLSNNRRSNDITNVKDLSEQNKISYGAGDNTSTYKFFQYSNDSVYAKIWSVMSTAKPTVFTKNNDEGKDRVLRSKGKYVFFMESTAIEYYTKRNCELKMVGSKLDSKDYGIAMPKRSYLKNKVDAAILHLQELGEMDNLKKKWWEDENIKCDDPSKTEDDSGSLQMKNTSGIFLVLGFGGFIGLIVAIIDFMLHANKIAVKEKITFVEAMSHEWKASLDPRVLHKAAGARSAAPSTRSSSRSRSRPARAVSVLSNIINFDDIY